MKNILCLLGFIFALSPVFAQYHVRYCYNGNVWNAPQFYTYSRYNNMYQSVPWNYSIGGQWQQLYMIDPRTQRYVNWHQPVPQWFFQSQRQGRMHLNRRAQQNRYHNRWGRDRVVITY